MKKLTILGLIMLLATGSVFAATSTTQIKAVVGKMISISPLFPNSTTIDETQTQYALGSIGVTSNSAGTWTIVIHSNNAGKMLNGTIEYPYQIALGTSAGNTDIIAKNDLTADRSTTVVKTAAATENYYLTAFYSTAASLGLADGTYTDNITVTISIN